MDIVFADKSLEQACNEQKSLVKMFGQAMAKGLRQRLDELAAAPTLAEFKYLPGRCRELTGKRSGQFQLFFCGLQQLIFIPKGISSSPAAKPIEDWSKIRSIEIIEVDEI